MVYLCLKNGGRGGTPLGPTMRWMANEKLTQRRLGNIKWLNQIRTDREHTILKLKGEVNDALKTLGRAGSCFLRWGSGIVDNSEGLSQPPSG